METSLVNGVHIAYARHGGGTPLVLLHGFPLDHTIWNSILPILVDEAEILLPDLRGLGKSGIVEETYTLDDMAIDIVRLLDHLNLDQVILGGHSMGGYIAMSIVRKFPNRVQGLGLVASQAIPDTSDRKERRYADSARVLSEGVGFIAESMSIALTPNPEIQPTLYRMIMRQKTIGLAGALKAMASRPDHTTLLSKLKIPVTVIHGKADTIIPIDRARDMKRLLRNGNLVEVENIAHMPMMEAPQETAEALRWLLTKK